MSSTKKPDFVARDEANEMTDAQREAICYHSKLLNKYFESYDDMLREEAEFKRQNEEKLKKQAERKERAAEVEDAYKKTLEARDQARKLIEEADKKYYELRNKFIQDFGSYHISYTNTDGKEQLTVSDMVDAMFDAFKNFPIIW